MKSVLARCLIFAILFIPWSVTEIAVSEELKVPVLEELQTPTLEEQQAPALALKGATLYTVTNGIVTNGILVIQDGKIVAVGPSSEVTVPDGTVVRGVGGKVILPGLVDTHSHLGVYPHPRVPANADGNETTGPVQSVVRALDAIYPSDPGIRMARAGGITTANIMPGSGNAVGGQTAYVKLRGRTIEDMIIHKNGIQGGMKMANGEKTLATANIELTRADPDWRTRLLSVITNPNVAYFLMIIGFYGIIFELSNPGAIFPGVIGAICLILALFAFQVLSVNYAGLALILLGLAFIVGEAFMPSFCILGIGGIVAFVAGSIILMDGSHQEISLPTIGGTALVAAGFILWTVIKFIGLRRKHPVSGSEQIVHERVTALDDFQEDDGYFRGHVRMSGERWNAACKSPVGNGDKLRVTALEGLTVYVEADKAEP